MLLLVACFVVCVFLWCAVCVLCRQHLLSFRFLARYNHNFVIHQHSRQKKGVDDDCLLLDESRNDFFLHSRDQRNSYKCTGNLLIIYLSVASIARIFHLKPPDVFRSISYDSPALLLNNLAINLYDPSLLFPFFLLSLLLSLFFTTNSPF